MDTELKSQGSHQPCSPLECSQKSGDEVPGRDRTCVHVAAGIGDMSLCQHDHQAQVDPSEDTCHLEQQSCDQKVRENAGTVEHASWKKESDISLSSSLNGDRDVTEGSSMNSPGSRTEGFPETSQGHILESYLSDFKSSGSSDWGLLDMSASCIDGMLGQLDSSLSATQSDQKFEEEEPPEEDNRCPSLFYVSVREDSWPPGLERACPSTCFVTQKDDSQVVRDDENITGKTSKSGSEQVQSVPRPKLGEEAEKDSSGMCVRQEDQCKENKEVENTCNPLLETNNTNEKHIENSSVPVDKLRKDECMLDKLPSDSHFEKEARGKEGMDGQKPAAMSFQTDINSFQINSEEHQQALQLLGLCDCTTDSNGEVGNLKLDMCSLSLEDSSAGYLVTEKTAVSPHCHGDKSETDIVSFVSDYWDENTPVRAEMDSKPEVHNEDYVKDGYIFNIEDTRPPLFSDDDSDMLGGFPQHTPSVSNSQTSCRAQQAKVIEDTVCGQFAEISERDPSMDTTSKRDPPPFFAHDSSEDLAMNCSVTDFSLLDLPPRRTMGDKTTKKESPDGNEIRPVPAFHGPGRVCREPPEIQDTRSGLVQPSQGPEIDLTTVNPTLPEYAPSPSKRSRQSGEINPPREMPCSRFQENLDCSSVPADRQVLKICGSQSGVSPFSGADDAGDSLFTEEERKPTLHSQGKRYHTNGERTQPCHGPELLLSTRTSQNHCVSQGNQVAELHIPHSSVHAVSRSLQSSVPTPNTHPPAGPSQRSQSMEASARSRTVVVQGQSLTKEGEELCQFYFESEKRSGGGEVQEEGGIVWNEEQKCYFITFVDSHVAERVAAREHSLKNCPLQVELWSPHRASGAESAMAVQPDRVLVSGVPPNTTSDCLQNYLECALNVGVASVQLGGRGNPSLVVFESPDTEIDLQGMERACRDSPLDIGVHLTFCGVPIPSGASPASSIVHVTGLKPETTTELIKLYFSNKRRTAGGPVEEVVRLPDGSSALVHFKDPADARAVVNKGGHTLDSQPLCVRLHEGSDSGGMPFQREAAESAVPFSSSSFKVSSEAEKSGSLNQPPRVTRMMENPQMPHTSPAGREFMGSQFSTSASAQMQRETEHRGPTSYNPGNQGGPNHFPHKTPAETNSFMGSPAGMTAWSQTSMLSGEGIYRGSPASHQYPAGPDHSTIINSHNNLPKQNYEERITSTDGRGPQISTPPRPGFRPDVMYPSPPQKSIRIKLGKDVIQEIVGSNYLLRQLIQQLASFQSKYQWDHPDHVIITSRSGNPDGNWEEKVEEAMHRLVQHIEQELQRRREPVRQAARMEADNPERTGWRNVDMTGMSSRSPANTPSAFPSDVQKPPSIRNAEDTVPSLKPEQIKFLRLPKALEKLKRDYPGLEISVNEAEKVAVVRAPETSIKKAFTDVLSFITNLREMKVPVSPAVAKMYKKKDAGEWIQRTLREKSDLQCYWEPCDDHIALTCQNSDYRCLEDIFRSAFKEVTCTLSEKEVCLLKSPAWASFIEATQNEKRGGCPTPVLMHEATQVIIVDTPSNVSQTRLHLRKFLDENKLEKEVLQMNPNHVRFLQQHCKEETRAVQEKASEAGVTVTFNKNGMIAEGPKDSLAETVDRVKELIHRIKENKMSFKKPGVATYLTGSKGQEFLSQTGTATGCYITTNSSDGASGDGASSYDGVLLGQINLDTNHQILIVQGDITKCAVDGIVNAANTDLNHGGGVALAIARAGGRSIQDESNEIVAKSRLREGEVVVTGAGSLFCSHVLHAVGPTWQGGFQDEEKLLIRTVRSTLKKAESLGLTSVAMPAISCGIFRYPVNEATGTIIKAVGQHFKDTGSVSCIKKLILIDVGAEPLQGFLTAGERLFDKLMEIKGDPKSSSRSGRHRGSQASEYTARKDSASDFGYGGRSHAPIRVIPGEIAKSKADVIVCTTHPSLDLKKGVLSKSILERGGQGIQDDLQKFMERFGQAELGKVVRTSGGNLDCKAVYHLSLPRWRDDYGKTMRSAVKECLNTAIKKSARSIAFPSLGTGRLGYPPDQVASIMFSAIGEWFQKNSHSSIKDVQIIVFGRDTETVEAFRAAEGQGGGSFRRDDNGRDSYSGGGRHGGHRHDSHGGGGHRGERHGRGGHRGESSGGRGRGYGDRAGGSDRLKTSVGRLTVMVKEGNILSEPCDAIVNTSNDNLDLSFGVLSKEISKACGPDLAAECRDQRDRMSETGVAVTRVDSSKLSCGNVIHVSADRFKRDWQEGVLAVLQAADEEGIRSISLPALGTGGRGADPARLAEAMQRAVSRFSDRARSVQEVRVVVFQKQMLSPYLEAFDPGAAAGGWDNGSDTSEAWEGVRSDKKTGHGVDVYIFSTRQQAIEDAREKIYNHVKHVCTTHTETHPLIANFSPKQIRELLQLQDKHDVEIVLDQKKGSVSVKGVDINVAKAVSNMKDIFLAATTERHMAAGMPPVRWQYETGKDRFSDFEPELVLQIEAAFKKKETEVQFADKKGRKYKIVFKDRKEYPVGQHGHPVTVRRRDILDEKLQQFPLPTHWDPMKGQKVRRVELKPDSAEYKRVHAHFAGQAQIKKIERIQNPTLFQQFKVKKKELEQYNPKGTENEKRLFHGTPSDSVDSIIANGFNRSYGGRHGLALGHGVYFALNSSTSMGFARGGHMFQCRVLVGEYTPGNSGMKMAPNKPNSNRPYDSVSDAPSNASVFVIFHDSQAYPEYLISF